MKDLTTSTFLAVGGLLMVAAALGLLFFREVPQANAAPMNIMLGAVLGWMGSTYAFYYGSTKTSQLKDDTINTLTNTGTGAGKTTPTTTVETPKEPTP